MEKWKKIKEQIDREVKKIWLNESVEIKRLKYGMISTKAGSCNQYFSTLVFALIYTLTLGEHVLYGLIEACDNKDISLDSIKRMTRIYFAKGFQSTEFLAYLGFKKTHTFMNSILEITGTLREKSEYKELLGSYFTYINILHWWIHLIFPWNLGSMFPQKSTEELKEIISLLKKSGAHHA